MKFKNLYDFVDEIMDNSNHNIRYVIELGLTYCETLSTYEGRQQLRSHLYKRQLTRKQQCL